MYYDIEKSGKRIQKLRAESGFTQERLAEQLNIDRSLLSHVEAGKRGCSVDLLIQFREFFKSSLDYIVLGVTHDESSQTDSSEQVRNDVDLLIEHLQTFKKSLG